MTLMFDARWWNNAVCRAIQITRENLPEVAEWCEGDLMDRNLATPVITFVAVGEIPQIAMIGDWVVFDGREFASFSSRSFWVHTSHYYDHIEIP